jgi:O-acetyl-ADP-ribose deacetylase (regulator of RNase III)
MSELELILVAPKAILCEAFRERFEHLPNVTIANSRFEDLKTFDCMVSAANSFGLMDGGVDAAIIAFFGESLMGRVQERILHEYLGEQPVGTSIIVGTDHPRHPYIAHTPTMRVPMDIAKTDNVYKAMWAMLLAVHQHNQKQPQSPIKIVACPGLGTATGHVPYHEAARQMALAYKNYLNPPDRITWDYAGERQQQIVYGGDMGLSLPPGLKL